MRSATRRGLVAVLAAVLLVLVQGVATTAVAAEGKTVTALSAATGGSGGNPAGTPINLAAVPAGQTTTITHIAWGDDCTPAGAPAYGFNCVGELVTADAVVESTLVAGSTATVTGEGVLVYTAADGFVADTVTLRSADGYRSTEVTIQIAPDDGEPLTLPGDVTMEVRPPWLSVTPPHLYVAHWAAPDTGIAYVTLESHTGEGTWGVQASGQVTVWGADPSGMYAGGTATVTFTSVDGDSAQVTLTAPPDEVGFVGVDPAPTLWVGTVAPGEAVTVDVATCEIDGRPPFDTACGVEGDVEVVAVPTGVAATVDGSVVTLEVDPTAPWGETLTVEYRVRAGVWSDPATITALIEPQVRVQPADQSVLTWAGAPVTWDVTAGLPDDPYAGGDIVSATVGDIRVSTTGELTSWTGAVQGTLEQDGTLLTFTPAPGFSGDVRVLGEYETTYVRTDGTTYTSSAYTEIAAVTVLGPVASDDTLELTVGEAGDVDLGASSLWGSTADLRAFADRRVSDGRYEGHVLPDGSSSEPVWVDYETSWTATGRWVSLDETRASAGARLIVSETGQADLGGVDPVVAAEVVDAAPFVGELAAAGTVITATATAEQAQVGVPFRLMTRSGIQGAPAMLWVDASGLGDPVEPTPDVVTPVPEPEPSPVPVDPPTSDPGPAPVTPDPEPVPVVPDAEPVTVPVLAETGPSAAVLPLVIVSGALVLAGLVLVVARPRRRVDGGA